MSDIGNKICRFAISTLVSIFAIVLFNLVWIFAVNDIDLYISKTPTLEYTGIQLWILFINGSYIYIHLYVIWSWIKSVIHLFNMRLKHAKNIIGIFLAFIRGGLREVDKWKGEL